MKMKPLRKVAVDLAALPCATALRRLRQNFEPTPKALADGVSDDARSKAFTEPAPKGLLWSEGYTPSQRSPVQACGKVEFATFRVD